MKTLTVAQLIQKLKRHYPEAHCALHYQSPFQLLVATILSAQCTDERVNLVTAKLFKEFPDALAMAEASLAQLEELVRPTGFFRNKAKNIKECSRQIVSRHSGQVPRTLEELVVLPGVGRKTANVVLGNAFQITSGIVVDTHVSRLSRRMGLTRAQSPERIEEELLTQIPKKHWIMYSHWLIAHGRTLCKARNPQCKECFLAELCPKRI